MITNRDTVYISGKISGIEEKAIPLFYCIEAYLKSVFSCRVINPVRQPQHKRWHEYMMHDVDLLNDATVLLQIPNWKDSVGSKIEYDLALMHGIQIIELPDLISFVRKERIAA